MSETKSKNDPMRVLPFALIWALASLIPALVRELHASTDRYSYLTVPQALIIGLLLTAPFTALLQVIFIERIFKRSMRGWLVYALLGAVITMLPFLPGVFWPDQLIPFMTLVWLVPNMLFQTAWLWPRVKHAWVWLVASFGGWYLSYSKLGSLVHDSALLIFLLPIGLAFILGFLMHYLLAHPKENEKAKMETATGEEVLYRTRLTRLQEDKQTDAAWDLLDDRISRGEIRS